MAPTLPEAEAPRVIPARPAGISWQPGARVLDLYEVVGILGEGGMGRVYRVRHPGWAMDLAVKVPLPATLEAAGGADLFEREAETWVGLSLHPHVVTCHYVRRVAGLPLIFAEFVDGGTFLEAIETRRLVSLEGILDVAIQFAWGLQHAHEQGLVHRDVKPANVMLTTDGIAKVTDFGLARGRSARGQSAAIPAGAAAAGQTMTVEGGGGATPAYVSPEQARGDALTRRSDLWSFGLSVLEAFLGKRSWRLGLVAAEVLAAYRQQGEPAPGLPKLPPALGDFLEQCFRDDPEQRPRGLAEAATVLIHAWEEAAGRPYPRQRPRGAGGAADGLNNRAVSLVDLGRTAEAAALWRKALATEPQHLEATYNASLAAWVEGQLDDDEAIRRMREACTSHASSPRAQQWLGRLELSLAKPADALACFDRARKLRPGSASDLEQDLAASRAPAQGPTLSLRGLSGTVAALMAGGGAVLAASGNEVRIWDERGGELLRVLDVPEGPVRALAMLSRGRLLLAAERGPLSLWDLASGRLLGSWPRHPGFATCLASAPERELVASGGSDRVVRLWDAASGHCLREMAGHEDAVTAVALGPTRLASASRDGTLRLWSVEDGRSLAVLRGHTGPVQAVVLDEAASRVISAGDDRSIRDWGLNSHECVRTYLSHTQSVRTLALSGGNTALLSGSADGSVRRFDCGAERLMELARLDAAVHVLAPAADGTLWAAHGSSVSALPSSPLRLAAPALCRPSSAVEVEERASSFEGQIEQARRSLSAGDFTTAVSLARTARSIPGHERTEAALSVWDDLCSRLPRKGLQSAWEEARLEGHSDAVLALAVDARGLQALTGGLDSTLRLWDLATHRPTAVLTGHDGPVTAVAFAGETGRAVTGGRDRTLRIWDTAGRRLLQTLEGHDETVAAVDVSPDGTRAASASWDGTVRLWDLARGTLARVLDGHQVNVVAVRFSSDGRALASAGWDGAVRLWHAESGDPLGTLLGHEVNVTAVAFHPAGQQLASGGEDGTLRLWDLRTRRSLQVLTGHEAPITAIAFSPDGRFLFSSSRDQSVRIWDARRGKAVRTLAHPAAVLGLAPLPLGSQLLSACTDRLVRLWHLDWDPEPTGSANSAETARPFLETLVSRRNSRSLAPSGAPASTKWSEADLNGLLEDLHQRGFGTLTRDSVRTELRSLSSPRATSFWDELRSNVPRAAQALPRAAVAVRRFPVGRLAGAAVLVALFAAGLLTWYHPKPRLRLSHRAVQIVRADVDLIDVGKFSAGCDASDTQAYLDRLVAGNPEAKDVACLAATASTATANAVIDAAPLTDPNVLRELRLRRNATSVLVGLGPAAVDPLCAHLGDPNDELRGVAAVSLGFAGTKEALACVNDALTAGTPVARTAAAVAFRRQVATGHVSLEQGWNTTTGLLHDTDAGGRIAGVGLLSLFAADVAGPAAQPLLDDADPAVAAAAKQAIGAIEAIGKTDFLEGAS